MCLSILEKKYRKPYKRAGYGFKVFERSVEGHLKFQYYPLRPIAHGKLPNKMTLVAPRGRWLKSTEDKVLSGDDKTYYLSGFHLYADRDEIERSAMGHYWLSNGSELIEVRWRGLKATGLQGGQRIIVVDEIFIPRDKK